MKRPRRTGVYVVKAAESHAQRVPSKQLPPGYRRPAPTAADKALAHALMRKRAGS